MVLGFRQERAQRRYGMFRAPQAGGPLATDSTHEVAELIELDPRLQEKPGPFEFWYRMTTPPKQPFSAPFEARERRHRFGEGLVGHQRRDILAAQLAGEMEAERVLQPLMLQHGGVDEPGQGRFAAGHLFAFQAQLGPDRVAAGQFLAGVRHVGSLSERLLP